MDGWILRDLRPGQQGNQGTWPRLGSTEDDHSFRCLRGELQLNFLSFRGLPGANGLISGDQTHSRAL